MDCAAQMRRFRAIYHALADTHDEHVRVMNATHEQFTTAMKAITVASHRITEMVDRLHEALMRAAEIGGATKG